MSNQNKPSVQSDTPEREYEQSGLYPKEGKPFRVIALLSSLIGVVVLLAVAAIILDRILI